MNMQDNLFKGFLLVFLVLTFLCGYTFLYENFDFLQKNFKQVNILFLNKKTLVRDISNQESSRLNQNILFVKDIIASEEKFQQYNDSIEKIKKYDGAQAGLIYFFQSLINVENKAKGTSRIGYYGDSMIEGDLMSMTLRKMLQKRFGGRGVGFMPITSITNRFRATIRHEFSNGWNTYNLVNLKAPVPLGVSGQVFLPDTSFSLHKVSYNASNHQFLQDFPITKLFYGLDTAHPKNNKVLLKEKSFLLQKEGLVNSLILSNTTTNEIELTFDFSSSIPIYGLSFESNNGILIDNFSIRGNSGIPMTQIQTNILRDFNKEMRYDLIILQFGLNVVSGKSNFKWYQKRMERVIKHFKNAMPNTSILIISIPDGSSKDKDGNMSTNPSVPLIVEAQKEAARKSKVAFLNLYEAMGGRNSMVEWVEELQYANKDYVHFNHKGAKNAANLIHEFLINEYEEFKQAIHD